MKRYLLGLFALMVIWSCGDDGLDPMDPMTELTICELGRYSEEVFSTVDSTTVKFSEKDPATAHPNDLFMDIFWPADDTLKQRPVMIWAFGGAFVTGDRTQMHDLAIASAKRGFVSASIDYRILQAIFPTPDSTIMMNTAVKATADMRAAIRYFYQDADTDNNFNVDANQIYVGGISAGAITALQAAILDESDINNPFIQFLIDANGGIIGNTGDDQNRTYPSDVKGVINLSGAVYDIEFLDATDPPIFSVHGDMDETVPYEYDFVNIFGTQLIKLHGSKSMFDYANTIGLRNDLVTVEGGGHTNIYTDSEYAETKDEFLQSAFDFLKSEICK